MGVDRDCHGGADGESFRGYLARLEVDAHRHALHDLDPVTGRILRREDGKRGACPGADVSDTAAKRHVISVEISDGANGLPGPQVAKLILLEISLYPSLTGFEYRGNGHPRRDDFANADGPFCDGATDGRDNAMFVHRSHRIPNSL